MRDQLASELVNVNTVHFISRSFAKNCWRPRVASAETSSTSWTPSACYTSSRGQPTALPRPCPSTVSQCNQVEAFEVELPDVRNRISFQRAFPLTRDEIREAGPWGRSSVSPRPAIALGPTSETISPVRRDRSLDRCWTTA